MGAMPDPPGNCPVCGTPFSEDAIQSTVGGIAGYDDQWDADTTHEHVTCPNPACRRTFTRKAGLADWLES